MFITYTKKNKLGGYTHEIEITPIVAITLTEMDTQTIQVELVEKRIIGKNKVFFTFLSHESIQKTVMKAFGRLKFPSSTLPIERDLGKINRLEDRVLDFLLEHRKAISESTIVGL